jgi:hypothetical protein
VQTSVKVALSDLEAEALVLGSKALGILGRTRMALIGKLINCG